MGGLSLRQASLVCKRPNFIILHVIVGPHGLTLEVVVVVVVAVRPAKLRLMFLILF